MANRISAGAVQTKIKFFFCRLIHAITSVNKYNGETRRLTIVYSENEFILMQTVIGHSLFQQSFANLSPFITRNNTVNRSK